MKRSWSLIVLTLLACGTLPSLGFAQKDEGAKPAAPAAEPGKALAVEIHGFVEMDMMRDDTRSLGEIAGNSAILAPGTLAGNNGSTQFTLRNTRLSFLAKAADIEGWKTKGYIESDFLGFDPAAGNSLGTTRQLVSENAFYTSPTFRIRHAYLAAEKEGWQVLVGQTWTIFAFNPDYVLSSVSLAPVMGTVYERTSQVRVAKTFGDEGVKVQVLVSADRPEEREAQVPNLEGGIRLTIGDWKGRFSAATGGVVTAPFSLALSGTMRDYLTPAPPSLIENETWGQAMAADVLVPILPYDGENDPSLVATAEFTAGKGYGDAFPNWSGGLPTFVTATTATNGYNGPGAPNLDAGIGGLDGTGAFTLVELESWSGQLQFHFPKDMATFVTVGYGELFSPNLGNLPVGTYDDDHVYFANLMHDFTPSLRAAVEYDRFATHYVVTDGSAEALDHRTQVSAYYRF